MKTTFRVKALLDHLGLDPIEGMARIALGDVVCPYCKGQGCAAAGRTQQDGVCLGDGREFVPLALRARMLMEAATYVYPKARNVPGLDEPDQDVVDAALEKAEQLAIMLDDNTPKAGQEPTKSDE